MRCKCASCLPWSSRRDVDALPWAWGPFCWMLPSSLTATSTRDTSDKTSNHRCNTTCTCSRDRMLMTCTPARSALRKNGCTNCVLAMHSCALVHTPSIVRVTKRVYLRVFTSIVRVPIRVKSRVLTSMNECGASRLRVFD